VGRSAVRAFAAAVTAGILAACFPVTATADPVLVFPGMEIHQSGHLCTLGFVDPGLHVAFAAGHCHGNGPVTDKDNHVIGKLATFRDNIADGAIVGTEQQVSDYESIVLANDVTANNILPGGRVLQSDPGLVVTPGEPVCHFGAVTGETCGTVEAVNNGWFTMGNGAVSQKGDSGGPVYIINPFGQAMIVGILNSVWGGSPAAVSWQATSQQVRDDVGVGGPSI
jgi:hypothetical protein